MRRDPNPNPEERLIEAENSERYIARLVRDAPLHLHHEFIHVITEIIRIDAQEQLDLKAMPVPKGKPS